MDQSAETSGETAFPASRAHGVERWQAFRPRAGRHYQANRNTDEGPGPRAHVSMLSPYLRRRLISEADIVKDAVSDHGPDSADKFIQEVFWRTYWKGWLEMRPQVWDSWLLDRDRLFADRADQSKGYLLATGARSGIECMDAWTNELIETGYLHNHVRMWYASIWIFTLKLPWQLGADFFYRHLLDGDPASNTLGWRWVAGIQTPGKNYVARASNIARFTENRFRPDGQLDESPEPLDAGESPEKHPLPELSLPADGPDTGLLILSDDCLMEKSEWAGHSFRALAACESGQPVRELHLSDKVSRFEQEALRDGLERAEAHFQAPANFIRSASTAAAVEQVTRWAAENNLRRVLLPRPPVGPNLPLAQAAFRAIQNVGIEAAWLRRQWDSDLYPHATRGFFVFKKAIPKALTRLKEYA